MPQLNYNKGHKSLSSQTIKQGPEVPHIHTQNGLAEAFIKWVKLITNALLMKMKLPVFYMGTCKLYMIHY